MHPRIPHRWFAVGLLTLALAAAGDDAPAGSGLPSLEELERLGASIGTIVVDAGDVFDLDDPREDRTAYRWINRLHRTTRNRVIVRQLLFRPGDPVDRRQIEECERLLRRNRYLHDATIRPIRYDAASNQVDFAVETRDVWTLTAGAGVGRAGGENKSRFEVRDSNLFGTGKRLIFERKSDVDRTSTGVRYEDPALLGSRYQLDLAYGDNSDGHRYAFGLERPFYSLDSRWAVGISADDELSEETRYALGHVSDRFLRDRTAFELYGGLSKGLGERGTGRWSLGWTYRRDLFTAFPEAAAELPEDRVLSYPWFGFDWQPADFVEERNLDDMSRVEDFQLGSALHARLGWSAPATGGDRSRAVFEAAWSTGLRPARDQWLLLTADGGGRWGADGGEDLHVAAAARWYWRDFGDQVLFATLRGEAGHQLDRDHQVLLGGDNGLRGYPLRYQQGDGSLLLTVEQRVFTDWYPWRLIHVGAAAFLDVGRTWGGPEDEAQGWLRDFGVGLRLGNARSAVGSLIHLDLAFPFDGDESIDRVQFLVTTQTSF